MWPPRPHNYKSPKLFTKTGANYFSVILGYLNLFKPYLLGVSENGIPVRVGISLVLRKFLVGVGFTKIELAHTRLLHCLVWALLLVMPLTFRPSYPTLSWRIFQNFSFLKKRMLLECNSLHHHSSPGSHTHCRAIYTLCKCFARPKLQAGSLW
jgi:hypothetical protein